jgi:hypothetical protein
MPKGFDLRCGARKTARVWVQGKRGTLKPGQALVLLPLVTGETGNSPAGYLAPLRQALIDNRHHVNVVVCESDYGALKLGNLGIRLFGRMLGALGGAGDGKQFAQLVN